MYLKKTGSSDREISFQIKTPKLPKETALISGQERTHDFPGIPFISRGRCYACILRQAASILTDVRVLYTKPTYCCKIQCFWDYLIRERKGGQDGCQSR